MFNIPNYFTFLRLICAPLIAFDVALSHDYTAAFRVFLVAALTDFLDGWLARKLNEETAFGAVFDPIADKVLMGAVFISLAVANIMPWWFVSIVIGRDVCLLVGAGALYLFTKIRKFPPSKLGKVSTLAQILVGAAYLGDLAYNRFPLATVGITLSALVIVSTVLTVLSGVEYAWSVFRGRKNEAVAV